MRLLNTKTLQVAEFYTDIPPYAILSHTWGKEEVTFQDIQILETAKTKAGWSKIEGACTYASKHHFDWIWIDSCCINKESSAELSEAINSMYQYYLDGSVCYVYLSDARKEEDLTSLKSTFRQSRWFTRGWTLQELLAPTYIVFLDKNWTEIGTRWSLRDIISAITRIPRHVFEDGNIHKYSIAQKMSWAAQRCTTRPEDQAYCLIGVFGISMSPIYGEGCAKAFMRLQQEIIKISDDRSIFAWIAAEEEKDDRGLLARSPYEFRASSDIRMLSEWELPATISSFSFNNNGLHIHMPQLTYAESHPGLFLAPLLCQSDSDDKYLSIYLKRTARGRYVRSRPSEIYLDSSISTHMTFSEVVVKQDQPTQRSRYTSMNQTLVQFSPRCAPPAHSNAPYSHRCASLDDKIYGYYPSTERVDRYTMNKYTSPASEYFAIVTWRCQFTVVTDKSREIDHFLKNEFTLPSRQDRLRTCLPSGEVLSVTLDITGTLAAYQRKEYIQLELSTNILPSGVSNIYTSLTKQIEPSPNWGFLVDLSSLRVQGLSHVDVYPPDCSRYDLGHEKMYLAIPKNGEDANPFHMLIVLEGLGQFMAFITFGLHESESWTDVIIDRRRRPNHALQLAEENWKSYLDGGSRAQVRLERQQDSRSAYSDDDGRVCGAVVSIATERKTLQLGTHSLFIEHIND